MEGLPEATEDKEGGESRSVVCIVDDDPARLQGLGERLREAQKKGTKVVGLSSLDEALAVLPELRPGCLLFPERLLDCPARVLFDLLALGSGEPSPPLIAVIIEDAEGVHVRALRSFVSDWRAGDDCDSCDDSDLTSVVGALLDRRDRRREETKRAYSERLGTLRRIFSRAAHEINNPAAIIRLAISAVSDAVEARAPESEVQPGFGSTFSAEDVSRLRELVQSADDALERIALGLRNLEGQAGSALGHQTLLTLDDVVLTAKSRVLEKNRSEGSVAFELGATDEFFGDKDQLLRLVLDLVDNAIEATGRGGSVRVRTMVEEQCALLFVEDSGPGVDAELVEDIFEPLFSTRSARGALGMGLARVWGIVERHGGKIRVDRSELGGARFTVRIPFDRSAEPLSVTSSQLLPPSGTERGPRILIVDDEPQIRDSYSRVLRRHFEVDVAPSSQAALSLIRERAYALILCDVIMPGEDGVALAQRLVRDYPEHASVLLFCTGGVLETPQERFLTMWENGFLRKPMSAGELVDSALAFIEAKSQLPLELEQPAS